MLFKVNKRRLKLLGIDALVFVMVFAFSIFLEFISYNGQRFDLLLRSAGA